VQIIELRTGKGTHSLSGILNIDAKRSIVNPRFNNRSANQQIDKSANQQINKSTELW
jgi:hypothetical protein